MFFTGIYTIKQTVMFIFKKSKSSARRALPKPAVVPVKEEKPEVTAAPKKAARKPKAAKPEINNEEKNTDEI